MQANKIGSVALDVVPRAGVVWSPSAQWTVKSLYGGAFRAPSINETTLDYVILKGNPNLVPEKISTFDLQMSYQGNRAQAAVGFFQSRMSDRIIQDLHILPGQYLNLGAVRFRGWEAESKYYWGREWLVLGSLLYQTNRNQQGAANNTPVPALSAKAGVSYQAENGVTLSLFDAYQGRIPGWSQTMNRAPLAFHSVNAHARWDWSKRWLTGGGQGYALFVHGNNLANREVWLPAWGAGALNTIPVSRGRTLYFGIEVWQKQ